MARSLPRLRCPTALGHEQSRVAAAPGRRGLPRIDRLTDHYNAISIAHLVPFGGEDLDAYAGAPRLVVADGSESFDAVEGGEIVHTTPKPGEVVWRDDRGVTCRRWNWRQCARTRLTPHTTNAVYACAPPRA